MTLDIAVRLTEILLGLALIQSSLEHLVAESSERRLFSVRLILSILLVIGLHPEWTLLALVLHALMVLHRFQGPYNGGSDRMGLLILCFLCAVHWLPGTLWPEVAFGYLALQTMLSYVMAGWVKLINPEWRSGRALQDVFHFSAYPASESVRGWAEKPRLLRFMSLAVIVFELCFPLCLLSQPTLILGLSVALSFHLANACLFGLNRFVWVWVAAYPSLLWFQGHMWG